MPTHPTLRGLTRAAGLAAASVLLLTSCSHSAQTADITVPPPPAGVKVATAPANPGTAPADAPPWPADSVIYTLYPSIFSPGGDFAGVTAQLPRLKSLGVTDLWVMPVTPIGHAVNGHPNVGSPYCVHDYYGVNPQYGTPADLHALIARAHALGIRVLLDEVLNHTAWDNALITQHPEYYVHSDGDPNNPASIKMAFSYSDVAQLDYADPGLRAYMTRMLEHWITDYHVDGFRFDCADNPDGPARMIPADFWRQLGVSLRRTKPDILMLGEEETPDLARKPFSLDYAWRMYDPGGHGALKNASDGGDASQVRTAWQDQVGEFPAGMQHMSVQDDWDTPRDVNAFGGPAGAQAVAVFDFTDTGVPLVYNGMEIGNAAGATNPHAPIDWHGGDPAFPAFYHALIALRHGSAAFQGGAMTWLPNSAPRQLLTYVRTGGGAQFLVEINLTPGAARGTILSHIGGGWKEVPLAGALAARAHAALPVVSLPPKGFALFRRPFRGGAAALAAMSAAPRPSQAGAAAPQDDASDPVYAQGYHAGDNGGSGFTPFQIVPTGTAGTFTYTAAEAEGDRGTPPPSTIDSGGRSFGLYAQSADGSITITRGFAVPLSAPGSTFSMDFVTGLNEGGTSGVALTTSGGTAGGFVLHGGNGVFFNGAPAGIGFAPGASHLVYTLTSPTTYALKVTGAEAFRGTGSFQGRITGFQVQQTDSGSTKPDHNAYFNNLSVGHAGSTP